jgi:hypothetical protein
VAVRPQQLLFLALLAVLCESAPAEGIFSKGGPDAGTTEYYEAYAHTPPGTRQVYYKGKLWPPFPRPTGPHQPFCHKYHTATYWPLPYVCQDRAAIETTSCTQLENGWLAATTLYDYHFDPETHDLNSSGRQHLAYLLTSVPTQYRRLSVASTFNTHLTDRRVASVEQYLAELTGQSAGLPVEVRSTIPLQRNAIVVEQIMRTGTASMPPPVIEYRGIGGGGSGS